MKKTRMISMMMALVLSLSTLAVPASAANYSTVKDGRYNIVSANGAYINVYAGRDWNGVNVTGWAGDGTTDQVIILDSNGDGSYKLRAGCSDTRVIDVYMGPNWSDKISAGDNVDIWSPTDPPAQTWYITHMGDGWYKIVLKADQSLALTLAGAWNGANLSVNKFTGSKNQVFKLVGLDGQTSRSSSSSSSTSSNMVLGQRTGNFNSAGYTSTISPFVRTSGLIGQCTWYCWARAYETTGIRLNTVNNAYTWLSRLNTPNTRAVWNKWSPRANSIAVYDYGNGYGHVRFVEKVVGSTVYYTEANAPWDNRLDANDGILKSASLSVFARSCIGYIYLK